MATRKTFVSDPGAISAVLIAMNAELKLAKGTEAIDPPRVWFVKHGDNNFQGVISYVPKPTGALRWYVLNIKQQAEFQAQRHRDQFPISVDGQLVCIAEEYVKK